jgi:hypothetical protein
MSSNFPFRFHTLKRNTAFGTATVTIVGLSTCYFLRLVLAYGWNGALKYIWDGDALPQDIRGFVNELEAASIFLDEKDTAIASLEEGLERARFDAVETSNPARILQQWRVNLPITKQDIRKHLAVVSSDLDDLAAKVDQVPSRNEVRKARKELSSRIVQLMSRTDRLIEFFNIATEESEHLKS